MNVLLLSPYSGEEIQPIANALEMEGDSWTQESLPLDDSLCFVRDEYLYDFVLSYGYQHIIKEPWLSVINAIGQANIHISYLPYNRGCSPNLWSWYEDTPKGISIHRIDAGIDTGPLLYRRLIEMSDAESLATSYQKLRIAACKLFFGVWPALRRGHVEPYKSDSIGNYHNKRESTALLAQFPLGYQTVVAEVRAAGIYARQGVNRGEAIRSLP